MNNIKIKKFNTESIYVNFLKNKDLSENQCFLSKKHVLELIDIVYSLGYEAGNIDGFTDGISKIIN